MTEDKKEVLQYTIDCLLYIPEYKQKLEEFNKQFNPHNRVRYSIIEEKLLTIK